jgi:puromycin-sensitive aminopeptidase
LTTLLRGILISLLASFAYDDPSVAREAKHLFAAFLENHNDVQTLPSDMRTPVFKIVLKNGGANEYQQVKSYFYKADNSAESKHVLNSLGCIGDKKLKLATMAWSTSGEIKLQDFFYAMGSGKCGKLMSSCQCFIFSTPNSHCHLEIFHYSWTFVARRTRY